MLIMSCSQQKTNYRVGHDNNTNVYDKSLHIKNDLPYIDLELPKYKSESLVINQQSQTLLHIKLYEFNWNINN